MQMQHRVKLLLMAAFFMQLGGAAGTIGVPILAKKLFGVSFWELAMIGVTASLSYCIACFLIGGLAKKMNPYRAMILGTLLYAAAFFTGIFVNAPWQLIPIYVFGGIGAAFFWPMLEAALVQGAGDDEKNNRVGLFNVSWSMADAIGAAIAGALYLLWPRMPFLLLLVTLAVVVVVTRRASRLAPQGMDQDESRREKKPSVSPSPEVRRGFANAAWAGNFVAHGFTGILRSVFAAPAIDVFRMSPLGIGLAIGMFNAVRTITFVLMRKRRTWTYNRGFFTAAHVSLAMGMITILIGAALTPSPSALPFVYAALSLAGVGCGVLYYSSIYYSVNLSHQAVSYTRLHEAYLGAGATGLVLGAGGLQVLTVSPHAYQLIARVGFDPHVAASMSPFILTGIMITGVITVSRRLFLKELPTQAAIELANAPPRGGGSPKFNQSASAKKQVDTPREYRRAQSRS